MCAICMAMIINISLTASLLPSPWSFLVVIRCKYERIWDTYVVVPKWIIHAREPERARAQLFIASRNTYLYRNETTYNAKLFHAAIYIYILLRRLYKLRSLKEYHIENAVFTKLRRSHIQRQVHIIIIIIIDRHTSTHLYTVALSLSALRRQSQIQFIIISACKRLYETAGAAVEQQSNGSNKITSTHYVYTRTSRT